MAGRGVAMISNDSIIIGFSSQKDTLAYLFYEGLPMTGGQYRGAQNDLCWFYTKEKIYVFDGTDGRWHSFPAPAGAFNVLVTAKEKYLAFFTSTTPANFRVLTIYNQLTKNFHQIQFADEYRYIEYLDDGLVFVRRKPGSDDYYGSFTVKNDYIEQKAIPCVLEIANRVSDSDYTDFHYEPRYSVLLTGRTLPSSDFKIYYYIIGFDTRLGYFTRDSVINDISTYEYNVFVGPAYSQNSYAVAAKNYMYKGERYASDLIIYNGLTGSFSTHSVNLTGGKLGIIIHPTINAVLASGIQQWPSNVPTSWQGINPFQGGLTETMMFDLQKHMAYGSSHFYCRDFIMHSYQVGDTLRLLWYNSVFNKIHKYIGIKPNTSSYSLRSGIDYCVISDINRDTRKKM